MRLATALDLPDAVARARAVRRCLRNLTDPESILAALNTLSALGDLEPRDGDREADDPCYTDRIVSAHWHEQRTALLDEALEEDEALDGAELEYSFACADGSLFYYDQDSWILRSSADYDAHDIVSRSQTQPLAQTLYDCAAAASLTR